MPDVRHPLYGYRKILERFEAEHRLRHIPAASEECLIDLLSNDYLGLGRRGAEFTTRLAERYPNVSFSSSASRLLSRYGRMHTELEDKLEMYYGRSALIFNSGYHANVGIVSALAIPGTLFLCDKAIHASVIDGLSMSGADYRRFRHNDMDSLCNAVTRWKDSYERIIIVAESIYSMDGDCAPLHRLVEIKRSCPDVLLYLDEAHAVGVRGNRGLGLAEEEGLIQEFDIIVGTFGKALASVGAFAIVPDEIKRYLVNTARPFIFSTAIPPVNCAYSSLMFDIAVSMDEERRHLMELSHRLRTGIAEITGIHPVSTSQIVPLVTGDACSATILSESLREKGFDTLPIRRPTVPPGGERIRFSLNASLSLDQVDSLLQAIEDSWENIIFRQS